MRRYATGLASSALIAAVSAAAVQPAAGAAAAGSARPHLYAGIGSSSSEYWSDTVIGAKALTQSVGGDLRVLADDFQGQKALDQFSAIFGQGCDGCAVSVDPASSAFTKAIVTRADRAGASIVTIWNIPDNLHPWNVASKHWVAHIEYDGVTGGYQNAIALIHAMGGKGSIVALEGIPDNPSSKQRLEGLHKALVENPGVTLLDTQVADWDQNKAQQITRTWLAQYGTRLKGIYSASDEMALGAIAALREKGLSGKIPVCGYDGAHPVLVAIKNGEMVSTTYIDGAYQGAITLALAYAAASGKLDPTTLPHSKREFFLNSTLVTKDNVDQILALKHSPQELSYATLSQNFWKESAGPVPPGANK